MLSMVEENIGLTSTVPVEVILAAGKRPVDLNNRFISSPRREQLIAEAEARGFPGNLCAWIKGIYSAAATEGIRTVAGVVQGDCSSTEKLLEVWRQEGISTIAVAYPVRPERAAMATEIERFARALDTTPAAAEKERERLAPLRALLRELDERTWRTCQVTGGENHRWLVSASDFNGEPERFGADLARFLAEVRQRPPAEKFLRLGYVGVPPIVDDLYDFLEGLGARVIFNEVQRQFAMLGEYRDLADQYAAYTYPYDTFYRLADIQREIRRRSLQGLIHYAQTFCHRQLETLILRPSLSIPLLTIEADKPGRLEPRTRTRLQAFLEQMVSPSSSRK